MERKIRVLDFIEEHERKWTEDCEKIKQEIYGGLEDLANYRLTNDSGIYTSDYVAEQALSFINSDWSLHIADKKPSNSYLMKSRTKFINALNTAIQLTDFKLELKEILDS